MDSTQRTRPRTGGSPVGLVIFIILAVVLAATTYWGFAKNSQTQRALDSKNLELAGAKDRAKKTNDTLTVLKAAVGIDSVDNLKPVVTETLATVKAEGFGADSDETAVSVLNASRDAVAKLTDERNTLQVSLSTEKALRTSLAEQKAVEQKKYEDALAKAAEQQTVTQKTLDDEKARLQAAIDKEVADREALREQYFASQDEYRQKEMNSALYVAQLQQKIRELSGEGLVLGQASGYVTNIDQGNKRVTINIGSSAGVKSGMRYVVFSRDGGGKAQKKGVVEVVTPNNGVSLAQIVQVEPNVAIGKGDQVYNLAGPKTKLFVFAGTPREYSLEQWTNYIRASGGEVAAQVQKGDQVADYLILGQFDEQDPETAKAVIDARDFGLKIVKESDLKKLMGLK